MTVLARFNQYEYGFNNKNKDTYNKDKVILLM